MDHRECVRSKLSSEKLDHPAATRAVAAGWSLPRLDATRKVAARTLFSPWRCQNVFLFFFLREKPLIFGISGESGDAEKEERELQNRTPIMPEKKHPAKGKVRRS